ncbi:MAG TPA: hypothetical protein VIS56_00795 [Candidatus Saccharimonadales bacterium]
MGVCEKFVSEPDQAFAGRIAAVMSAAVSDYSRVSGIAMPVLVAGEYCAQLSALSYERLTDAGVPMQVRLHTRPRVAHYYLRTADGRLVADATWQQFLASRKRGGELPAIAVYDQQMVNQALGYLGLSRRRFVIWNDAEDSGHRWYHFNDPVLNALLED